MQIKFFVAFFFLNYDVNMHQAGHGISSYRLKDTLNLHLGTKPVHIKEFTSTLALLGCEVPHGSVLGPLFFTLYPIYCLVNCLLTTP